MTDTAKPANAPAAWSLGGAAPAPQTFTDPKPLTKEAAARLVPSDSHTGTDPSGRAIGPKEDHRAMKPVMDDKGKIVTPKNPRPARRS